MMHERMNARSMGYTEGARMPLAYMPCLASAMPIMIMKAPHSVEHLRSVCCFACPPPSPLLLRGIVLLRCECGVRRVHNTLLYPHTAET